MHDAMQSNTTPSLSNDVLRTADAEGHRVTVAHSCSYTKDSSKGAHNTPGQEHQYKNTSTKPNADAHI
jgi:hypothetical protein